MDDLLKFLLGSAWLTALVFGLIKMAKGAIAIAVQQAGAREIVRLKGDLAKELEVERQAFVRELESERRRAEIALEQFRAQLSSEVQARREVAEKSLEAFKAQLTLEAEVRRQVAARKVDAILRFIELGNGLIKKALFPVLKPAGISPNDYRESILAADEYRGAFRDIEAFFDLDARREILAFLSEVEAARDEYNRKQFEGEASMIEASDRAEAARAKFFEVLRRELEVEMGEMSEAKS